MPKQNKLKAILAEKQLTVHDFAISVEIKPSTFYKKLGRSKRLHGFRSVDDMRVLGD